MREYANLLGGANRYKEAAKVFENILAIGPDRIDVMLILTYINYTLGNQGKAEEYTNRVLSMNKDNPEANFNLGILELKKGNKEEAKQILNSVIKRFPDNKVSVYAKTALQKL
jgi:TolA-binding protein